MYKINVLGREGAVKSHALRDSWFVYGGLDVSEILNPVQIHSESAIVLIHIKR